MSTPVFYIPLSGADGTQYQLSVLDIGELVTTMVSGPGSGPANVGFLLSDGINLWNITPNPTDSRPTKTLAGLGAVPTEFILISPGLFLWQVTIKAAPPDPQAGELVKTLVGTFNPTATRCPGFIISNAAGDLYQIGVRNDGEPITLFLGQGTPNKTAGPLVDISRSFVWLITADSQGRLKALPQGNFKPATQQYAGSPPNFLNLVSANLDMWVLTVNQFGRFGAAKVGSVDPDPILGQLFNYDLVPSPYPRALQPGGPTTPVTSPLETEGEKLGIFVFGCGHFFNDPEVVFTSCQGYQVALLCCPMCRFVQRIFNPASLIYAEENAILIA